MHLKLKIEKQHSYLGKIVNILDGAYICAGDVGTTKEDLFRVNDRTSYVAGITLDSSKPTALGVFTSIGSMLEHDQKEIEGTTFVIEGLGKVGAKLAKMLSARGGIVKGYDPFVKNVEGVQSIIASDLFTTKCDVYVPCIRCNS